MGSRLVHTSRGGGGGFGPQGFSGSGVWLRHHRGLKNLSALRKDTSTAGICFLSSAILLRSCSLVLISYLGLSGFYLTILIILQNSRESEGRVVLNWKTFSTYNFIISSEILTVKGLI